MIWNRKTGNRESGGVYILYMKIILISVPIGILMEWFRRWIIAGMDITRDLNALLVCCTIGAGYCLLFAGIGYALKIEEIKPLLQRLTRLVHKAS